MRTSAVLSAIEPARKTADHIASFRVNSGGVGAVCAWSVDADATSKTARSVGEFIASEPVQARGRNFDLTNARRAIRVLAFISLVGDLGATSSPKSELKKRWR